MQAPVRDIDNDEVLTQYGVVGEPFRAEPRWDTERELSLCGAAHDPAAAALCVVGQVNPRRDACRWTTAGSLRTAGFVVRHDPVPWNDHHVAVSFTGEWNDSRSRSFDEAFEE
ncbi:MAG TPA: hypothetical protein VIR30_13455 [Nocardioides sp.]